MSAWIVPNESINKIVNSFYWLNNNEFMRGKLKEGFKIDLKQHNDEDLNKELKRFGQILVSLNCDSVNQRYDLKKKPFKFVYSDVSSLSIFQFLKSVECLTYQSCEGTAEETELYKFLIDLESNLRNRIIQEMEEYKKARWE